MYMKHDAALMNEEKKLPWINFLWYQKFYILWKIIFV